MSAPKVRWSYFISFTVISLIYLPCFCHSTLTKLFLLHNSGLLIIVMTAYPGTFFFHLGKKASVDRITKFSAIEFSVVSG